MYARRFLIARTAKVVFKKKDVIKGQEANAAIDYVRTSEFDGVT